MKNSGLIPTLFACLLAAGMTGLYAQNAATIIGVVRDQDGRPFANASIAAVGQKSATKRTLKSDDRGRFVLSEIPPDSYQIGATCDTCNDVSSIVEIGVGQTRSIELKVNTQTASTEISVDTHATTMDATSAQLGFNLTAHEIADLPDNGRTYAALALTAPLVSNSGDATFDDLRFAGQSNQQNRYSLDGVDASSIVNASPGFVSGAGAQFRLRTSVESVQEFRVDSAMYLAEDGFGSGGQIKLVSKAGGNNWRGNLFEYFRNDHLDARNFFDGTDKTKLRMNQFGGSVGGPLRKDALFIFAGIEELRQRAGQNVLESVPSPEAKLGADPAISPLLQLIPAGATATADPAVSLAVRQGEAAQNETDLNVRTDYLLSMKERLFIRYSRSMGNLVTPDETTTPRNISATTSSDNVAVSLNSEVGLAVSNQITFGFNRAPINISADGGEASLSDNRVIIGSGGANVFASPGGLVTLPDGDFGRAAGYRGRSYDLTDNLNWIRGSHSVKGGVDLRALRLPFQTLGGTSYQYLNADTFLQNFDADVTYVADLPSRVAEQEQFGAFLQDEWRLRPNMTISLGLRYEYYSPTREWKDRASLFDYTTFSFEQERGGFYTTSKFGFSPRLAMTWSPKGSQGNTVFRIGSGIYQGPLALLDTLQPIQNDAARVHLLASSFPQTPDSLLSNPDTVTIPYALDAGGFGNPQRNIVYSASIQQATRAGFVAQIGYLGSLSRHLTEQGTTNLATSIDPLTGDPIRVNPRFAAIQYLTNGGTSFYNALSAGLSRRFVDSLTVSASFNWAHSIGNSLGAGESQAAQDPNCLACERADNDFDVRRSFNFTTVYSLPFGPNQKHLSRGLAGSLLGGFTLAGAWNARGGLPVNVLIDRPDEIYRNSSNVYYSPFGPIPPDTIAVTNVPSGGEDRSALRPNLVSGVNPYVRDGSGLWLNPAAFSIPGVGTLGNLGRNALRGPAFSQVDLQISRNIHVGERNRIEFRAEAFNVLNRANFANPASTLLDVLVDVEPGSSYTPALAPGFGFLHSTVGRTVGLGTARQFELSARYEF